MNTVHYSVNTPETTVLKASAPASLRLRNVALALAFALLPYAAMSGILLLDR